ASCLKMLRAKTKVCAAWWLSALVDSLSLTGMSLPFDFIFIPDSSFLLTARRSSRRWRSWSPQQIPSHEQSSSLRCDLPCRLQPIHCCCAMLSAHSCLYSKTRTWYVLVLNHGYILVASLSNNWFSVLLDCAASSLADRECFGAREH